MLSRNSSGDLELVFSWGRYLHWEELMFRNWTSYMDEKGANATTNYAEWLGVYNYWAASLYVVIEGWETAKFSDPIIHALLGQSNYKEMLRKLRNGTFHYQPSLIPQKFIDFFQSSDVTLWLITLHEEFCRCLRDWLDTISGQTHLKNEIREGVADIIGWIPLRPAELELKALRNKFDEIEARLDASGSNSVAAQELRAFLSQYDVAVKQTADAVRASRRNLLAKLGLNPDDYIK
jgi:hypothetical protein